MRNILWILFLLTFSLLVPNLHAQHVLTGDIHKEKGLTCKDCHVTESKKPVSRDKCQECHGSYADLAKTTEHLDPNPHYNHTIDLDCNYCHHMHKPAVIYCRNCHQGLAFVPKPVAGKDGK